MAVSNPLEKVEDPRNRFETFYASPHLSGVGDRLSELANDRNNGNLSQEMSTIAVVQDSRVSAVNNYPVSDAVLRICFLYSKGGQVLVYSPVIDINTLKVKGFKYDKGTCLALPDPKLFDIDSSSPGLYVATDEGHKQELSELIIVTSKEGLRFPSYENNGRWCAPCVDADKATGTLLDVHDPENYGLCTKFVDTQDEAFALCRNLGIVEVLLQDLQKIDRRIIKERDYDKRPEDYAKRPLFPMELPERER